MTKKELLELDFPKMVENKYELKIRKVKKGYAFALYYRHDLQQRFFMSRKQYFAVVEENKKISQKAYMNLCAFLEETYKMAHFEEIVLSDECINLLQDILGEKYESEYQYCNALERKIEDIKESIRKPIKDKRLREDTKRMKLATKEPKGFEEWLAKRETYFLLKKDESSKKKKAICACCGHEWKSDAEKDDMGDCPKCKAHGLYKTRDIKSVKHDCYSGLFLAKNSNGEVMEIVKKCYVKYDKSYLKRSVTFWYGDRRIVTDADDFYERCGNNYKHRQGYFNRVGSMYKTCSEECYMYPNNIKRVLKGTAFEYMETEMFARAYANETYFIKKYLQSVQSAPICEQLMKNGYRSMVYNFITYWQIDIVYDYIKTFLMGKSQDGRKLHSVLGVTKEQFEAFKEKDVKYQKYALAIAAFGNRSLNGQVEKDTENVQITKAVPIEVIDEYVNIMKNENFSSIGIITREPLVLTSTYINYLKQRDVPKKSNFLKDYMDYLGWLKEMNYKLTKSRLRPKDFKKEHDRIYREYINFVEARRVGELKARDTYMKEIQSTVEELFKIELLDSDYEIVVPTGRGDLIYESEKLGHCVRTYDSMIYNHNCVILFVRKADELNEPFYTMEVTKKCMIRQCRTRGNVSYEQDENLQAIITKYQNDILERIQKKECKPLLEKLQFAA